MAMGQEVGEKIGGGYARWPERVMLRGRVVKVVGLDATAHGASLWEGVPG